jgi:hypothetical protein
MDISIISASTWITAYEYESESMEEIFTRFYKRGHRNSQISAETSPMGNIEFPDCTVTEKYD